jgi:hypothetical protein
MIEGTVCPCQLLSASRRQGARFAAENEADRNTKYCVFLVVVLWSASRRRNAPFAAKNEADRNEK